MLRVIGFLYVLSCQFLHNLTDMHQKPSAYFSLCVDMVPMVYQWNTQEEVEDEPQQYNLYPYVILSHTLHSNNHSPDWSLMNLAQYPPRIPNQAG
jgi:hypothetical protein